MLEIGDMPLLNGLKIGYGRALDNARKTLPIQPLRETPCIDNLS
jgi:hypothetical protein